MRDHITLKVKKVEQETSDTVTIHFKQPLFKKVKYKSGQFLTLNLEINGEKVSRSYSMSSAPSLDPTVAVTVKRVDGGLASNFLNDKIKAGDSIKMLPPMGHFVFEPNKQAKRHIVLFGAGSGITPLMSILKSALNGEPESTVSLIYGNRKQDAIIFKKNLDALKEKFGNKLNIINVLSQPENGWSGYKGRIDRTITLNALNLLPKLDPEATEYYMCGPEGMMEEVEEGLKKLKVPKNKIHKESFTSSNESEEELEKLGNLEVREVTVIINEEPHKFEVKPDQSILDAGLDDGLDMPFSCQSGLCTACRCRKLEGEVKMTESDGLSESEIEEGYILACVGHPTSDGVVIRVE
ncbi:ferredoxin--NADP reductase [Flexithrix dorotheae]|uniref:ferredoxin--NADP reductase n=1 Tax=Flexithrix dorotheae TaxID=70993 RepID=UPI0003635F2C|nr:ferredoxin--NADP reductase [Flexithrix dorotheae]